MKPRWCGRLAAWTVGALLCAAAIPAGGRADEPKAPSASVEIKWKLGPGEVLKLTTTRDITGSLMELKFHSRLVLSGLLRVSEIDANNQPVMALEILDLKVTAERPDKTKLVFDSKAKSKKEPKDPMELGYWFLARNPLVIRLNPTGDVQIEVDRESAPPGAMIDPAVTDLMDAIGAVTAIVPEGPVALKSTWKRPRQPCTHNATPWNEPFLTTTETFTLMSLGEGEEQTLKINVSPDVYMDNIAAVLRAKVDLAAKEEAARAAAGSPGGSVGAGTAGAGAPAAAAGAEAPKVEPPKITRKGQGQLTFRAGPGLADTLKVSFAGDVKYEKASATLKLTRDAKLTLEEAAKAPAARTTPEIPNSDAPPAPVEDATPAAPPVPEGECPFGQLVFFEKKPEVGDLKAGEGQELVVVEFESASPGKVNFNLADFVLADGSGNVLPCAGLLVAGQGVKSDVGTASGKIKKLVWKIPAGSTGYTVRFKDKGLGQLE